MVFSSTVFLFLFLPIVLILYFAKNNMNIKYKNFVLLIASLIFYAYGEPIFILLMLFSIIVNYYLGIKVETKFKKIFMVIAYLYNLLLLFIFKYLTFFIDNLELLLKKDIITINIALPIGISFFTFQMLSYVLDIYNGKAKAQKNILNVALYVSLFPQLIAGPIVRYETISKEIDNRKINKEEIAQGIYRFVYGLSKKVLLSNYVGLIADNIFYSYNNGIEISAVTAWIGSIAYSFQIYFDFSGYSDMAIGLGKIFGFHFDENFNYPYISKTITEFWRRWHISLSTWFRDYIYIPLGGNKKTKSRTIINLFIVWLFTGLWHGANWTFICWGIYYFVLLIIEKYVLKNSKILKNNLFSHIYTLFFINIGWIIFKSSNLKSAIKFIGLLFTIGTKNIVDGMALEYIKQSIIIFTICSITSTPIIRYLKRKVFSAQNCLIYDIIELIATICIFILSILSCIRSTYNPFIYFNF